MTALTPAMTRGSARAVADRVALFTPPAQPPKQTTLQKIVPWIAWHNLTAVNGMSEYMGPVDLRGFERQEGYLFSNNIDAYIYVGSSGDRQSLINNPLLTLGPFSSGFMATELPVVNVLAQCAGYDFTTPRKNIANGDTRFSGSTGLEIKTATSNDPQPKLRSSWTRIYDSYDLTGGNPFTTVTTGGSWTSAQLALEGMSGVSAYGSYSCTGGTGSNVSLYLTDAFPTDNSGVFQPLNAGVATLPTAAGLYYAQFTASGTSTPTPRVVWSFLSGGTAGVNVTFLNLLITIAMGS